MEYLEPPACAVCEAPARYASGTSTLCEPCTLECSGLTRITVMCPLPPRQRAVLMGLAEGKVHKQIARDLGISVGAVRSHTMHICRWLKVIDRAQAVIAAYERGWLPLRGTSL